MAAHHISKWLLAYSVLTTLLVPVVAGAEFYSYEDGSGTINFVDDLGKIPKEYRQKKQVRKDRYDDLPEKERALMLERDRQGRETERRNEAEQQDRLRMVRSEEKAREAQEQLRKALTTPVTISGRQIFVPVKLVNGSVETTVQLLLDTGASSTVITPEVATLLNIGQSADVNVKVVGGRVLSARKTVLSQIQVGPVQRANQEVVIVNQRGSGIGDGLLGMSFLAGLKYTIDFQKQTINWIP